MSKIYTFGRDPICDFPIQDDSCLISRIHAELHESKGKYTIVDRSTNGTYVNGLLIEGGIEIPVKRGDRVSFAHMIDLDWEMIPKSSRKRWIIFLSVVGGLLLTGLLVFGSIRIHDYIREKKDVPSPADTTRVDTEKPKDEINSSGDNVGGRNSLDNKRPISVQVGKTPEGVDPSENKDNQEIKAEEEISLQSKEEPEVNVSEITENPEIYI